MTRSEIVVRLREARGEFDARVAAIPDENLDLAPPSRLHSPKEIVAHVNAYEELITLRLRAAREGAGTTFERDRDGWEAFNERVWDEARDLSVSEVIERSGRVFEEMLAEVEQLTDEELNQLTGLTAYLDSAWLKGKSLADLIAIDAYEHYPMHFTALDAARG